MPVVRRAADPEAGATAGPRLGACSRDPRQGPGGSAVEAVVGGIAVFDHPGLKERLGELARSRRAGALIRGNDGDGLDAIGAIGGAAAEVGSDPAPGHGPSRTPSRGWNASAVGVEEFLPGGEWRDERGAVFVHERLRSAIERPRLEWGRLGEAPTDEPELSALTALGLESALFLDLETGGLASSPVFLAGTMYWNGADFILRQYFARHFGEEGNLLPAPGS